MQKIAPQAKSEKYFQIWFFPRFGGKNGGVLSVRMQVILDSSFARLGSAPIGGGQKGEFRDWTKILLGITDRERDLFENYNFLIAKKYFYSSRRNKTIPSIILHVLNGRIKMIH